MNKEITDLNMGCLTVQVVETPADRAALDDLLWEVLWNPLGLPRNVRNSFKASGQNLELTAKINGHMVGGAVVLWRNKDDVELRHLAVVPSRQGQGVGRELVAYVINKLEAKNCSSLQTYARDSSAAFFEKLGFIAASERLLDHEAFTRYGIAVRLMKKDKLSDSKETLL